MTTNKHFPVGIHAGPGGNLTGAGQPDGYWVQLAMSGKKPVLKSVDNYGPIFEALNWCDKYGIEDPPFVFRLKSSVPGWNPDVPNWNLMPASAAVEHCSKTIAALPPEFDKRVWLELINEPDKDSDSAFPNKTPADFANWLGEFMLFCAIEMNSQGYRVTGPGYSSGEPEFADWLTKGWMDYLEYCANHYDEAAIALHEYAYTMSLQAPQQPNPYMLGRFQDVHRVCDTHSIRRPRIHITEFGWTYNNIPDPTTAMHEIVTIVTRLYGHYSNISHIAIWYSGMGFSKISNKVQKLFQPLTNIALNWSMEIDGQLPVPSPTPTPTPPTPAPIGKIDMAQYFLPASGNYGPIYMIKNNWGQGDERVQLQRNSQWSYVTKNQNWERRYIGKNYIYLQADTSPNEQEFYTVEGKWMPRYMAPGESFTRQEHTQYYKKADCTPGSSVDWQSLIQFEKLIEIPDFNLKNVAKLHWIFQDKIEETYFFAPGVGLVGWSKPQRDLSSWLHEFVPAHEEPNKRGQWCTALLKETVPTGEWLDPEPPPPPPPIPEPPIYPYPYGVDIARYQKDINPQIMQAAGVEFCWVRASQGYTITDGYYLSNSKRLIEQSDILVGSYHMFHPTADPIRQATHFIDLVRKTGQQNLPPALDLENLAKYNIYVGDPDKYRAAIKVWLEIVEDQLGHMPLLYTNVSWYNKYLSPWPEVFEKYGLWIANWTTRSIPAIPYGRTGWDFWQYGGESGVEHGVKSTTIDANYANFADSIELTNNWGKNWLVKSGPQPTFPAHRRVDYARTIFLLNRNMPNHEQDAVWKEAQRLEGSIMFSYDDAGSTPVSHNHVIMFGIAPEDENKQSAWFKQFYPEVYVTFDSVQRLLARTIMIANINDPEPAATGQQPIQ